MRADPASAATASSERGNGDSGAEANLAALPDPARCESSYGHPRIGIRPESIVTPVFACSAM